MTKINVRSPYYLSYGEPSLPSVEYDSNIANASGLAVDQFGNVDLPVLEYGNIISYTSSDSDFANGKFDTVTSDTSREIVFTVSIPENFSNSGDETFDLTLTTTQPTFTCTGGVTNNGTIPNQALDTDGDYSSIDLSNYFTAGSDPIFDYIVINSHTDYVSTSINPNAPNTLEIYSTNKTGTITIYVQATDGNALTCNATQSIQVTISAVVVYDCDYSNFIGGGISNTGTITEPGVNGDITAIKETSGGSAITSYPANNTGSSRQVTLYFDITVPNNQGFTNAGGTVECSKTFTQSSTSLPEFTCSVAGLTSQAVASNGTVKIGIANKGTIDGFTPLSFDSNITVDTSRTVRFEITPPASGFSNSGGDNIFCDVTMVQPAPFTPTIGSEVWYMEWTSGFPFITVEQWVASGRIDDPNDRYGQGGYVLESWLNSWPNGMLSGTERYVLMNNAKITDNIGSSMFAGSANGVGQFVVPTYRLPFQYPENNPNPTKGIYFRVSRTFTRSYTQATNFKFTPEVIQENHTPFYYVKYEPTDRISEVWSVDLIAQTFQRIA